MTQAVYIAGSHLWSALSDPDNLAGAKTTAVEATVEGHTLSIPYLAAAGQHLYDNPERLRIITHEVIEKAIRQAGWSQSELDDCAVFVGSTSFSLYESEQLYKARAHTGDTSALTVTSYTMLPDYIVEHFAPNARVYTFNTACTSAANAMLYGARMIRNGDVRHALVVGLEFFNEITLFGFHSLGLVSQLGRMQPFSAERDGLTLGEGASAVLLSADKPQKPCWEFVNGATLGDTHSMTAANPDGSSIEAVIRQALEKSAVSADDIRAIKLHGTASLANDDVETLGLKRIYGNSIPPTCVLKPAIGHTLGACGTNELVLLTHYLDKGLVPGLPYTYALDENLPVNLSAESRPVEPGCYLLNYFGFGGNNTSLIIRNAS